MHLYNVEASEDKSEASFSPLCAHSGGHRVQGEEPSPAVHAEKTLCCCPEAFPRVALAMSRFRRVHYRQSPAAPARHQPHQVVVSFSEMGFTPGMVA